jgi:hypothetical protein
VTDTSVRCHPLDPLGAIGAASWIWTLPALSTARTVM